MDDFELKGSERVGEGSRCRLRITRSWCQRRCLCPAAHLKVLAFSLGTERAAREEVPQVGNEAESGGGWGVGDEPPPLSLLASFFFFF